MEKHVDRENAVTITEYRYTATHLILACLVLSILITLFIVWCVRRCQLDNRILTFLRRRFNRGETVQEATTSQIEM